MYEVPDENSTEKVWVISKGEHITLETFFINEKITGIVKEYKISDIGLYMVNPNKIDIFEKLIGYEVIYKKKAKKNFLTKLFNSETTKKPRTVLNPDHDLISPFEDKMLESAFTKISDNLLPYDSVIRSLLSENKDEVENILAYCQDPGKNKYSINLAGSIQDKIQFVRENLYQDVKITLKKSYLTNGIFEMRGFDFDKYDQDNFHRLIKYVSKGKINYAVLNSDGTLQFKVENDFFIKFMFMLEQSINSDDRLLASFQDCLARISKPHKLYFSKDIDTEYSDKHMPPVFRDGLDLSTMDKRELSYITDALNRSRRAVYFNTIIKTIDGDENIFTTITVMHDFNELVSVKKYLPEIYTKIEQDIPVSEIGKLYLLDSMSGHNINI